MLLKHCSFTSSDLLQRRLCLLFEELLQMRPYQGSDPCP